MSLSDGIYFERLVSLKEPENFKDLDQQDKELVDACLQWAATNPRSPMGYPTEWKSCIDQVANNLRETRQSRKNAQDRATTYRPIAGLFRQPQL